MRRAAALSAVFLSSFAILSVGAASSGLATAWVDPVARIQAQDEAVYAATSLTIAHRGDWLTPRFLGRYALYKPPLLYWLSAASALALGDNAFALRLPSLLSGAGSVTLVFAWVWMGASLANALTGTLLALSSHLFFVLSRVAMMDALLTFCILLAMSALARDPALRSSSRLWTFALACGAAMLVKGVAGVIPLLAAGLMWSVSSERPGWRRAAWAVGIAAAVAGTWHFYQLFVHPKWFWAEYVRSEILAWGLAPPQQTTGESQVWFYLRRLWWLDPALFCGVGLLGCRRLLAGVGAGPKTGGDRRPLPHGRGSAWFPVREFLSQPHVALIVAVAIAVLMFQYRNAAYLMPMYPAMAVVVGLGIPARWKWAALAAAVAMFAFKGALPGTTWGLPFKPEFVNPSYKILAGHAATHRANDLILVDPDDEFYSATLPFRRVRYLFLDPAHGARPKPALDFEYLGITVSSTDFAQLEQRKPEFERRLREFGLNSADPIATGILAGTEAEIAATLTMHPEADFFVPARWASLDGGAHEVGPESPSRVLLLSRVVVQGP
jgi:4-amino-4-deoxy-L-arabinose transferase-like glycosyltransferase